MSLKPLDPWMTFNPAMADMYVVARDDFAAQGNMPAAIHCHYMMAFGVNLQRGGMNDGQIPSAEGIGASLKYARYIMMRVPDHAGMLSDNLCRVGEVQLKTDDMLEPAVRRFPLVQSTGIAMPEAPPLTHNIRRRKHFMGLVEATAKAFPSLARQ